MSKPSVFADLQLPSDLVLDTADSVPDASTNSVYFCRGRFMQSDLECYLKVADRATQSIENERAILEHIRASPIPIPKVIAFGGAPKPYLLLSRLPGSMLWDLIDPRRSAYRKDAVLRHLQLYGATLARIHALDVDWSDQRRSNLEEPISFEEGQDIRFRYLVDWLSANRPTHIRRSFVHGDYNTGNARVAFLNSRAERDAILSGYHSCGHFEAEQLRWCEVLNYAHFAHWTRETDLGYSEFALAHAESAAANVN
jgi:Ser/Thr protein kinase RdoA (MazF antagonist)